MDKVWGYEKWILSTHKSGISYVYGEQKNLREYLGKDVPIIIKEIKTNDFLSVQVHPSDDYARKYENDNGKTECWYILDVEENASLICGIDPSLSKKEFSDIVRSGNVEKSLKQISVNKGDMIYIPSGVVHAIGKGIKLLEIQQCSDITYRICDWGRGRELNVEKALDVINFSRYDCGGKIENFKILETPYFTVEKIRIRSTIKDKCLSTFNVYFCIDGSGSIFCRDYKLNIYKNDTVYIDNGTDYLMQGNLDLIKIY